MRNPLAAFARWLDRKLNPPPVARSIFAGAAFNRLTGDWAATQLLSPNQETKLDLPTLRARSRQLERDNALVAGAIAAIQDNVVGWRGVRLQARLEKRRYNTPQNGYHDRHNMSIEEGFADWGAYGVCTACGYYSFADLQRMLLARVVVDGEFILRHLRGYPNGFGYALQVLDADQLDHSHNVARSGAGNEIRQGVEIDAMGRPVAYHLLTNHPSEVGAGRQRERVPAADIVHRFIPRRPGQPRGIPLLAPCLIGLGDTAAYTEAEIKQARLAAAQGGFFVTKGDHADLGIDYSDNAVATERNRLQMEVEPGLSRALPPGMEFQPWDPTHPNGNYGEFKKAILKELATGIGLAYSTFSGDLAEVSFTSSRVGLLRERDAFRALQHWLGTSTLTPIYREWLMMAYLTRRVTLPSAEPERWARYHEWEYRGWASVQPREDIAAAEQAIKLGVLTRRQVCAESGLDHEEVFAGLAEEQRLATEYDITINGMESGNAQTAETTPTANPAPGDEPAPGAEPGRDGRAHPHFALVRSTG